MVGVFTVVGEVAGHGEAGGEAPVGHPVPLLDPHVDPLDEAAHPMWQV